MPARLDETPKKNSQAQAAEVADRRLRVHHRQTEAQKSTRVHLVNSSCDMFPAMRDGTMTKVEVKNYGPAMLLDSDDESALVQLLREGRAQNLRVSIEY